MMIFSLIMTIGILIVLPATLIFVIWRAAHKSKFEWFMEVLATTAVIAWIFQSGHWSYISIYWRYLWVGLLIIAVFISWQKIKTLPLRIKYNGNQQINLGMSIFLFLIFGLFNFFVFTSYSIKEKAVDLVFPLKEGSYYVGHGGNHVQMNYHQDYPPQKYALDILGVNKMGTRAKGLIPKDLEKYEIYGHVLSSPCDGTIIEVENNLPDLTPPEMDPDNATGNYVALTCNGHDAIIYLAHMQKGSVAVAVDEEVVMGQKLGRVGNSGNTSEPHLHIHAEINGQGIPITFEGKFLVRNNIVR